jgi:hypothetical protein
MATNCMPPVICMEVAPVHECGVCTAKCVWRQILQARRGLVLQGEQEPCKHCSVWYPLLQHVVSRRLQYAVVVCSSVIDVLIARRAHGDAWSQPQQLTTRLCVPHAVSYSPKSCLASRLAQCSHQIGSCRTV